MSTRSAIGIKENGKVRGIYCHYDGYISGNGLELVSFYKDKARVEKLINLGNLRCLGVNFYPPKITFPDRESYDYCFRASGHYKISFCDFYGGSDEKAKEFNNDYDFTTGIDGEYAYLFDTSKNKWFVLESDVETKKITYFDLEKLLTNRDYFIKFRLMRDSYWIESENDKIKYIGYAENEWEDIQDRIKTLNKQMKETVIDICNYWIHEDFFPDKPDMSDIEFGVSETKELGKHYVIFAVLKNGESKRKVLKRSKNINDLTLAVCNQYGLSPYMRPFFDK